MAIAALKKIEILAHRSHKDQVLEELQRLGEVEITQVSEKAPTKELDLNPEPAISPQRLHHALSILEQTQPVQENLLEKLVKIKVRLKREELEGLLDEEKIQFLLKEIERIEDRLKELDRRDSELQHRIRLLLPWQDLKIPLDSFHHTATSGIVMGTISVRLKDKLLASLDEATPRYYYEELSSTKQDAHLVIIYLKEDFIRIEEILRKYNFQTVNLPLEPKLAEELLVELEENLLHHQEERRNMKNTLENINEERMRILTSTDYYASEKEKLSSEGKLLFTEASFLIQGWIRKGSIRHLRQMLERKFPELVIFIKDPEPGERIPTALENKAVFRPFEVVTNLYGQPAYGGVDPTSFLSVFFLIGFAYCLSDAGYGLIILALSLIAGKLFRNMPQAKKFFNMFAYCGLATVLIGGITGSWFGNAIDKLPASLGLITALKNKIMIIDPIKNPLVFLVGALVIGIIQIACGVIIRFVHELKNRLYFDAFFRELAALVAQFSLVALVLSSIGVVAREAGKVSIYSLIGAVCAIIIYQWRANDRLGLKIFWTFFGPYSVITGNFLADTLSYSRLFALGLTTGLLATAINEICFLVPGMASDIGIPVLIGVILAVIIFIVAHLANIAISILGAYVHTSRLQYLEFFTKFFEGGGRPFCPFKKVEEYTVVEYS